MTYVLQSQMHVLIWPMTPASAPNPDRCARTAQQGINSKSHRSRTTAVHALFAFTYNVAHFRASNNWNWSRLSKNMDQSKRSTFSAIQPSTTAHPIPLTSYGAVAAAVAVVAAVAFNLGPCTTHAAAACHMMTDFRNSGLPP